MKKTTASRGATRARQVSGGELRMVSVRLSVAYLKIIEAEAANMGLSRGLFLSMLVKSQQGTFGLERRSTTVYQPSPEELKKTQLYMWKAPVEVRDRIDAERMRLGHIPVGAYLIYLVNNWLGAPNGLKLKESKRKN